MSIGKRIREKRITNGLKIPELSKLTKLSTGNISDLENGKNKPSIESLIKLSDALDCSIDWLATGKEKKKNEKTRTDIENDIINMFNILDEKDKEDIFDFLHIKYEKAIKKGKKSLYSTYTEKNETVKEDDNLYII